MAKKSLQLGRAVEWPDSPEKAVLDRVPNPQAGTDYLVRFTAPEFTSICPVTGQPLGSMGPPFKVVVQGQTVFLCCDGCEAALRKSPEKYLAKLRGK